METTLDQWIGLPEVISAQKWRIILQDGFSTTVGLSHFESFHVFPSNFPHHFSQTLALKPKTVLVSLMFGGKKSGNCSTRTLLLIYLSFTVAPFARHWAQPRESQPPSCRKTRKSSCKFRGTRTNAALRTATSSKSGPSEGDNLEKTCGGVSASLSYL